MGRLTAKKGFKHLVDACALLAERGLEFSCSIVGGGSEHDMLQRQIAEAGLDERVTLTGELDAGAVLEICRGGSVFVLPSVRTADGDRDGVPNALLEAMALRLPVVTTSASAANEAIEDGVSGMLVPPGDAEALAARIADLLADPALRKRLGDAGRAVVEQKFNLAPNGLALFRFLERCAGSQPTESTGTL